MSKSFHLDGLRMNAVQTAPNGVVNHETVFQFCQDGQRVHATYAGGQVARGSLVGMVNDAAFEFCYCQMHVDGTIDSGRSQCELRRNEQGLVQIVEHFEWSEGTGTNVIQELRDAANDVAPTRPQP